MVVCTICLQKYEIHTSPKLVKSQNIVPSYSCAINNYLNLNLFITWFVITGFGYNTDQCWTQEDHLGLISYVTIHFTLVITRIDS